MEFQSVLGSFMQRAWMAYERTDLNTHFVSGHYQALDVMQYDNENNE